MFLDYFIVQQNVSALSRLQLSKCCPRKLSELPPELKDPTLESYFYKNYGFKNDYINNRKPSLTFNALRITEEITKYELDKSVASCGLFFLNKKKAHKALYLYNNYIKRKYYDMVDDLSNNFKNYASKKGIPIEDQEKYWMQCEEALIDNLRKMEIYFNGCLNNILKSKLLISVHFKLYLKNHETNWYQQIRTIENEWAKFFLNKMKNYRHTNGSQNKEKKADIEMTIIGEIRDTIMTEGDSVQNGPFSTLES
ncbi:RAD protein (Pv-fam-e) [Plasmodium ovale curtisi]|uniref:RAD protein (Pv-fam-e) n=1 Tax=Plasmodium ovale curtisi TaxID=864141 RepID=A0A1A8VQP9_PLAOA|nr:RAD protein (Pv-fam-e) [Plasmodium ovale curtisi]